MVWPGDGAKVKLRGSPKYYNASCEENVWSKCHCIRQIGQSQKQKCQARCDARGKHQRIFQQFYQYLSWYFFVLIASCSSFAFVSGWWRDRQETWGKRGVMIWSRCRWNQSWDGCDHTACAIIIWLPWPLQLLRYSSLDQSCGSTTNWPILLFIEPCC